MGIYSAFTRIYPIASLVELCLFCFVINQQLNAIKIQVESLLFVTGINKEDTINEIRDASDQVATETRRNQYFFGSTQ